MAQKNGIANMKDTGDALEAAEDLWLTGGGGAWGGIGGNTPEPTVMLYSPALPILLELSSAKRASVYLHCTNAGYQRHIATLQGKLSSNFRPTLCSQIINIPLS